jgi:putative membrane protein
MNFTLVLKGMAMGIAEAIPGVSGGTIAFITGIYERLLRAIGAILGTKVAGTFRREGFRPAWREADGFFLLQLGGGMVLGLIVAVFAITYLLEHYPTVVWGFFFGLIISSAIYVGRQIANWRKRTVSMLIIGAVVAYLLTTINPLGGSSSPLLVFLSGSIAISALILPGVSGSFILVLLGMYTVVFGAVRGLSTGEDGALLIVACFAAGCLVGLALFAKLLTWTFKTYPDATFALLTGFMIGSLNKLWPWRNVITTRLNSSGEEVPVLEANVMPGLYEGGEPYVIGVILAVLGGLAIVFLLEATASNRAEGAPFAE